MAEARNIETLSVFFTAGAVAGTLISPGFFPLTANLCLSLVSIFLVFRKKLFSSDASLPLILCSFLLLGLFCYVNSSISYGDGLRFPMAERAAGGLCAFIDSIPFAHENSAPLLKALLTGDRSSLPKECIEVFRKSGASHILALSGLHIGIIYLIFDKLTFVLGKSPRALLGRFILLILGAGFFTLMTGAGPSIVRAFLFILINETLRLSGRERKPMRVLCVALLIQLALDPSAINSLGFQLSYLAMAGIFILFPVMDAWYPKGIAFDPMRKIWSASALSISCQVFTGPLVWLRFHSFPKYFLLTNLFALPLTTILMATAIFTLALHSAGICPHFLIAATDGLCTLLVWVLKLISM